MIINKENLMKITIWLSVLTAIAAGITSVSYALRFSRNYYWLIVLIAAINTAYYLVLAMKRIPIAKSMVMFLSINAAVTILIILSGNSYYYTVAADNVPRIENRGLDFIGSYYLSYIFTIAAGFFTWLIVNRNSRKSLNKIIDKPTILYNIPILSIITALIIGVFGVIYSFRYSDNYFWIVLLVFIFNTAYFLIMALKHKPIFKSMLLYIGINVAVTLIIVFLSKLLNQSMNNTSYYSNDALIFVLAYYATYLISIPVAFFTWLIVHSSANTKNMQKTINEENEEK